jgi:acetyl-CoA C-acetyltransferase
MAKQDERHTPVLVGAGQVNDRAASGAEGLDSLGLMAAAARLAARDAGVSDLSRIDWLGVVSQISFPEFEGTLAERLAQTLGLAPSHAEETPLPTGDSPVRFINDAANAIGAGEAQIALIVGGEALRTASRRAQEAARLAGDRPAPSGPLPRRKPRTIEARHRYGLVTPADVYALYENAARAAWGQSLAEGQAETAQIWSLMSRVAARNEAAWLRQERSADDILAANADNRPIAFPFNKLMVANAAVNQGAAVLMTSLAMARELGVDERRMIHVGKGAAAHEDDNPFLRPDFAASASMEVSLTKALELNEIGVGDVDLAELYSCFPCVPKMARRILGWPAGKPATVFGGLTFGGGPIGNYMTHAAASMIETLRRTPGAGLLFANGGFATHNHTILLTTQPQPAGVFPQDYDFQAEADARRPATPALDETYEGAVGIETYTVLYDRDGAPRFGVVIGRTPDGRRAIGRVPAEDRACIALLTSGVREPVGTRGRVERDGELNRFAL